MNFFKKYEEIMVVLLITIAFIAFPKLVGCLLLASLAYSCLYGGYIPTTTSDNWINGATINIAYVLGCTMISTIVNVDAVSLLIVFLLLIMSVAERYKRYH